MNGERLIVILLAAVIVLGVLILLLECLHYVQWRQHKSTQPSGGEPVEKILPSKDILPFAIQPLSHREKRFLVLFLEGKTTEEIAAAMHVEPSSVYTMKYRIRKKFPADYSLPF